MVVLLDGNDILRVGPLHWGRIRVSPDLPGGLVAVENGKLDVHEDEIGPLGLGLRHASMAVRRLGNVVT
jgi:hypothetical protein